MVTGLQVGSVAVVQNPGLNPPRISSGRHLTGCRGFSLLEVLLTVFIVSIGLLGLGQLSIVSNQASRDAFFQSQADVLAYDMIDRMRANRLVAAAGSYDLAYADANPGGTSVQDADRADWRTLLAQALPQAQGEISRAGNIMTVRVRWPDPMTGALRETTVSSEL
jgi:type IV pilus assembly protein PilV